MPSGTAADQQQREAERDSDSTAAQKGLTTQLNGDVRRELAELLTQSHCTASLRILH